MSHEYSNYRAAREGDTVGKAMPASGHLCCASVTVVTLHSNLLLHLGFLTSKVRMLIASKVAGVWGDRGINICKVL